MLPSNIPKHSTTHNRRRPCIHLVIQPSYLARGVQPWHWPTIAIHHLTVLVDFDAAVGKADAGDNGVGHERALVDRPRPVGFWNLKIGGR